MVLAQFIDFSLRMELVDARSEQSPIFSVSEIVIQNTMSINILTR